MLFDVFKYIIFLLISREEEHEIIIFPHTLNPLKVIYENITSFHSYYKFLNIYCATALYSDFPSFKLK